MQQPKLSTWQLTLGGVVLVVAMILGIVQSLQKEEVPAEDIPEANQETSDPLVAKEPEVVTFTGERSLAVPFVSQAPLGVWDAMHEETCEEASIVMAVEYLRGAVQIEGANADGTFTDLVAYESSLRYGPSMTAAQVAMVTEGFFPGYDAEVIENPTIVQLRQFIDDGYPVIVPAAGRELGNPFFTGEGPLYHMLVLRGYIADRFITNDPGTQNGENYTYTYDVLMAAIGDWNDGDPVKGAPRVVVIRPNMLP